MPINTNPTLVSTNPPIMSAEQQVSEVQAPLADVVTRVLLAVDSVIIAKCMGKQCKTDREFTIKRFDYNSNYPGARNKSSVYAVGSCNTCQGNIRTIVSKDKYVVPEKQQ